MSTDDPPRSLGDLWQLVRPIVVERYDRELRRRRLPAWRDLALAGLAACVVLLAAYVAGGGQVRTVYVPPGEIVLVDPFSGQPVRCALAATEPVTRYDCTIQEPR